MGQQQAKVAVYLDAGARALLAKAAGQSPAAGWDVRDLGDGLHLLGAADADLGRTEGAPSGFSSSACPKEPQMGAVCSSQAGGRRGSKRAPDFQVLPDSLNCPLGALVCAHLSQVSHGVCDRSAPQCM